MRIDEIIIHPITLPFSRKFSHARKRDNSARNIVVEIIADGGNVRGFGEGAPRPYVTGESPESAVADVERFLKSALFPWELNSVSSVWRFVDSLPQGRHHRAAICALEMGLLDAVGKFQDIPITDYFSKDFFTDRIQYGGTIPVGDEDHITEMCLLIKSLGMQHLRIKMDMDAERNKKALEVVCDILGVEDGLRADSNSSWHAALAWHHLPLFREYNVTVIEDPLSPGDPGVGSFSEEAKNMGITLMADESACTLGDVKKIIRDGHFGMVNVRLSKCGGFRNSLKIIELLRKNGVCFQIGCQLGESGLLSAAGRALSVLCGDAIYYDGSYDVFLLKENITEHHVSFGSGGKAGPLKGAGLGVSVNQKALNRLGDPLKTIHIGRPWAGKESHGFE